MKLKITATLSREELTDLVATEMRRRFGMPGAEITMAVHTWGEAEITITEAEPATAKPITEEIA